MNPYWSGGGVVLYHGDCRDVLPTIGPVDHTITDPPYEAEAHTLQRRVTRSTCGVTKMVVGFDAITESDRAIVGAAIAQMTRRWALVFCQIEATQKWVSALAGMSYRRTCIWVKPTSMPQLTGDRPGMGYETFVASHAPGRSTWNGGGRNGVFTHVTRRDEHTGDHQTVKPLSLMAELVRLFTGRGETILDPFAGSGSTLVAAWRQHRLAVGMERE